MRHCKRPYNYVMSTVGRKDKGENNQACCSVEAHLKDISQMFTTVVESAVLQVLAFNLDFTYITCRAVCHLRNAGRRF